MLSSTFRFTQSNLQDYVDCPRRFQLRYVQGQSWPGVEADPFAEHEAHLERGARFHRLVERHQLGLDAAYLEQRMVDSDVREWWRAYQEFDQVHALEGRRYPEVTLVGDLDGNKLAATYDLLVIVPDHRVVIFDWKTYHRVPGRRYFEGRMQTRLYPFLVVLSGAGFAGGVVAPDDVSMVYWTVSDPSAPVRFEYSQLQYEEDIDFFGQLLRSLRGRDLETIWPLVADDVFCRFCTFRSLCGRGEYAGRFDDLDGGVHDVELDHPDFGFGDVEEVGF